MLLHHCLNEKSGIVIVRENILRVGNAYTDHLLSLPGYDEIPGNALFFDLEHYVYKKPLCIGVFGCCYFDNENNTLHVTQYMIEKRKEIADILYKARDYFETMYSKNNKKYIVTFSGNNDFTVMNYLFNKYKIKTDYNDYFKQIDIQKVYEKVSGVCTGLKTLEKKFDIVRNADPMSGSNLAKTFSKIIKDDEYIHRMPSEKIEKILLYNEQDVINLFHICVDWNKFVGLKEE